MSRMPASDWDLAVATGSRLVRPGPSVTAAEARAAVQSLRRSAERAQPFVRETAALDLPASREVLVVDRPSWIRAAVQSMAGMLPEDGWYAGLVGGRVSGVELGTLLSWLAAKILGQFDPFGTDASDGRLLLVAPNIVHAERELDVNPDDFRLWVALHEETHRVQFAAADWLRPHLRAEVSALFDALEPGLPGPGELVAGLRRRGADAAARPARSRPRGALSDPLQVLPEEGLLSLLPEGEAAREVIDRVGGLMSLLEGHAEVVMDEVGPQVVPSVARIRARFEKRRDGRGLDRVLRRLLGMDLKLAQYRQGARFCRTVLREAGRERLNEVFAAPERLPSLTEIREPEIWLERTG